MAEDTHGIATPGIQVRVLAGPPLIGTIYDRFGAKRVLYLTHRHAPACDPSAVSLGSPRVNYLGICLELWCTRRGIAGGSAPILQPHRSRSWWGFLLPLHAGTKFEGTACLHPPDGRVWNSDNWPGVDALGTLEVGALPQYRIVDIRKVPPVELVAEGASPERVAEDLLSLKLIRSGKSPNLVCRVFWQNGETMNMVRLYTPKTDDAHQFQRKVLACC